MGQKEQLILIDGLSMSFSAPCFEQFFSELWVIPIGGLFGVVNCAGNMEKVIMAL